MEYQTKKICASFNPKGYIQPVVREVFKDLTDEPSGSKDFKIATKFVSRYLEKLEKGEFDLEENCWKNKDCVMGASSNAIKIPPLEFVFKEKRN